MGRGGGPIGAIFRGVKSVVGGIGKTIMGGLGVGKKKKQKPAPSAQDAQTSVNMDKELQKKLILHKLRLDNV